MPIVSKSISPQDLVLDLDEKTKNLDISKYEDFLYELCGDWEFQKEAIRNSLRFFLSKYKDTKQLFEENYKINNIMQDFAEKEELEKNIPFPYKKSCTIDLATGTGKTWVMYAVARILLVEGLVDQVLILCPSRTIKYEVYKKFTDFTANSILTDSLPKKCVIKIPGVKHSDSTIEKGDICIDNVHKTYDHVSSSINDSLERKGNRTLVINDEAHHILNPKGSGDSGKMLEWMNFLKDERYGFKYVLNLSGTPYKGDVYFNDVISRFSIREAINQKFVKDIEYLSKDESKTKPEKWKAILSNHKKIKKTYTKAKKHITIVVTNSIAEVNKLVQYVREFLEKYEGISSEEAEKKVIPVTSSPSHDEFREKLKIVDSKSSPVEWIISVSILTEGWDVKNVFQIVPHEKRAFNSKLLISQVLGRGLRIPEEYAKIGEQPKVKIFNHTAWSTNIDRLVEEIAEITSNLQNKVIKNSKYNFDLPYIKVDKKIETKREIKKIKNISLPKSLGFSTTNKERRQEYTDVRTHRISVDTTKVSEMVKEYSVEEATNSVYTNIFCFDMDKGTNISEKVTKKYIRNLIKKELKKINEEKVSEENLQLAKLSFNGLFRQFVGVTKIEEIYGKPDIINTKDMRSVLVSESSLKNNGGLITCKENLKKIDKEDLKIINKVKEALNEGGVQTTLTAQEYIRARIIDDIKQENYKAPTDMIFVNYTPERDFAEMMVRKYSNYIDSWIKSPDSGFYEIPYIHRPGTHSIQKNFNPDFFIKKGDKIIVVEIKSKDDSSVQNKDKYEGAMAYFNKLNEKIKNIKYEFHFLDPRDYNSFFEKVIVKGISFTSQLHATLESKSREELKEGR